MAFGSIAMSACLKKPFVQTDEDCSTVLDNDNSELYGMDEGKKSGDASDEA